MAGRRLLVVVGAAPTLGVLAPPVVEARMSANPGGRTGAHPEDARVRQRVDLCIAQAGGGTGVPRLAIPEVVDVAVAVWGGLPAGTLPTVAATDHCPAAA